jgi:hypothetical protein
MKTATHLVVTLRASATAYADISLETTIESSDFSSSTIPDSVFAIPAGLQASDKK